MTAYALDVALRAAQREAKNLRQRLAGERDARAAAEHRAEVAERRASVAELAVRALSARNGVHTLEDIS